MNDKKIEKSAKKIDIDEMRSIWLAGFLSVNGALLINGKAVTLVVNTTLRPGAVKKFAKYAGANARESVIPGQTADKTKVIVTISGGKLHDLMIRVWEYLPKERKAEYAALRKELKVRLSGETNEED